MKTLFKLGAYLLLTYGICALVAMVAFGIAYGVGVAPEVHDVGILMSTLLISGLISLVVACYFCIEKPWD